MFPKKGEKVPEIRFGGFTDDWEQRKLDDDLVSIQVSENESIRFNNEFSDAVYKFSRIGNHSASRIILIVRDCKFQLKMNCQMMIISSGMTVTLFYNPRNSLRQLLLR